MKPASPALFYIGSAVFLLTAIWIPESNASLSAAIGGIIMICTANILAAIKQLEESK